MACEGFLSKRLRRFSKEGQPPRASARCPLACCSATRLGGTIATPRQARNVNHRHNTKREYGSPFIRADAFSLAAAVELRDGQLHPTIAGTIMAKTPTAKTQTAKKPISKKSPAKAVAKAPVKKATSVATKPAKAPAKKSTSVAKKPTLKPAAKSALPKKQTADRTSSIAGTVLKTAKATVKQVKTLAGSVLGQDETKGKRKK